MESLKYNDLRHNCLANIFDEHQMDYIYKSEIRGNKMVHLLDFHLPDYGTIIQFLELGDYWETVTNLMDSFSSTHYNLITMPPSRLPSTLAKKKDNIPNLRQDQYKDYVFKSIEKFLSGRLEEFQEKIKKK